MEYDCKPDNLLDLTIGSCRWGQNCLLQCNPISKSDFIKYQFPKPSLFSSASNCSASCPSVDTFSKFRAQADLTVTPPGSNDVDPSIFNSFPGGYFSVKPTEEFWINPGDFLGFSGTGVAGSIGYRWQCSQRYFRQMHFFILQQLLGA